MFDKRINIFVGHYGSGKSEIAVNSAFFIREKGFNTTIVDMDIVNPYFRSKDAENLLKERDIKVITTLYANSNVDVPALPAELKSVFENKTSKVVLDVGGDDAGATALGVYNEEIINDEYDLYIVINTNRPETCDVDSIIKMIREIEYTSRLKITKLVNNTNLLGSTTQDTVEKGAGIIYEVSKKLDIPVAFTAFMDDIEINSKIIKGDYLKMKKFIRLPF